MNSAAIVAKQLRAAHAKVAVLDVDYHAGNGTVGLFWDDPSVFVSSVHADPNDEYPYACGFADQVVAWGKGGAWGCCVGFLRKN